MCILALTAVILSAYSLATAPPASSQPTLETLTVTLPGEDMRTDAEGRPIIISGMVNYLNLTFDEGFDQITIFLEKDAPSPGENHTWRYQFSYNRSEDNSFKDEIYGLYLETERCNATETSVSFAMGVHAEAQIGAWMLNVTADGFPVQSKEINVIRASVGISTTAPTLYYVLQPFNATTVKTRNTFFRIANTGNIPAEMNVNFDVYGELFSVSNVTGKLSVGEERRCDVTLHAPDMVPQRTQFKGRAKLTGSDFITNSMVNFIPSLSADIDIVIEVRRSEYNILDLERATLQYQRLLSMRYGETLTTDIYISGSGSVFLDINHPNFREPTVTVDGSKYDGSLENIPLELESDEEVHIIITTTPTKSDTFAYVNYTLDTGYNSGTASTKVLVKADPNIQINDNTGVTGGWLAAIIISLVIIMGVAIIVYQIIQGGKK